MNPLHFLVDGNSIYVKNKNSNTYNHGIIKSINSINNISVNCTLLYDNTQELINETLILNDYSNENGTTPWKFDEKITAILRHNYIDYDINNDGAEIIEEPNNIMEYEYEDRDDEEEEDEDDECDDDHDDDEDEDDDESKDSYNKCDSYIDPIMRFSGLAMNLSITAFFSMWTYKLAKDANLI